MFIISHRAKINISSMQRKIFFFFIVFLLFFGCVKDELDKTLENLARDRTISDKEVLETATKKIFLNYGGSYSYEIKKYNEEFTLNIEHRLDYPKAIRGEGLDSYRDDIFTESSKIIRYYFVHFRDRRLYEVNYLIEQQIIKGGRQKVIDLCKVRVSKDMMSDLPKKNLKEALDYIKRNWSVEIDSFYELDKLIKAS